MKEDFDIPCNIAQSLNIIGDRWTLLIIHEILLGHHTFNEIKKPLKGLSSNLLSARLKFLEQSNLITAELYSDHPPRFKYDLTESGKDLEHVFHSLILWGGKHLKKCYKKLLHAACEHEVEIAYHCPHCNQTVDDLRVAKV
ncbi:MAG TPA: helix-turn-helix domain-containing protein [Bacilli bacterium]